MSDQLFDQLRTSHFILQVDEATDVAKDAYLIVIFVIYWKIILQSH
jgi:hypothetical protein